MLDDLLIIAQTDVRQRQRKVPQINDKKELGLASKNPQNGTKVKKEPPTIHDSISTLLLVASRQSAASKQAIAPPEQKPATPFVPNGHTSQLLARDEEEPHESKRIKTEPGPFALPVNQVRPATTLATRKRGHIDNDQMSNSSGEGFCPRNVRRPAMQVPNLRDEMQIDEMIRHVTHDAEPAVEPPKVGSAFVELIEKSLRKCIMETQGSVYQPSEEDIEPFFVKFSRVHEERILREPGPVESKSGKKIEFYPCVKFNPGVDAEVGMGTCIATRLEGMEGKPLMGAITPDEYTLAIQEGVQPTERRLCILCSRYETMRIERFLSTSDVTISRRVCSHWFRNECGPGEYGPNYCIHPTQESEPYRGINYPIANVPLDMLKVQKDDDDGVRFVVQPPSVYWREGASQNEWTHLMV